MSFGFPAHYSMDHHPGISDPSLLNDAALRAIAALGWDLKKQDEQKLIATCGIDIWSWGEEVRIGFLEGGTLRIISKCIFPLQCIDHGQNKKNVEDFLITLDQVLEEG